MTATTGDDARSPLEGFRVLELSAAEGAVSVAGQVLAAVGADVVLPADWEAILETLSAPGDRHEYERARLTAGKRIDAALTPDRVVAELDRADVILVDSIWAERLAASGVDHARWTGLSTERIVARVSGFPVGSDLASLGDSDLLVQAVAGIAASNGRRDDPSLPSGVPVADLSTGLFTAAAVLAAAFERLDSGRGEYIETSGLVSVTALLGTFLPTVFTTGRTPDRIGNRHSMTAPWNVYPASNGYVVITTMGHSLWTSAATLIGRPELIADPRFATTEDRVRNVDELDAEISSWTSTLTTDEVLRAAKAAGVPCATISELASIFASPSHPLSRAVTGPGPEHGWRLPRVPLGIDVAPPTRIDAEPSRVHGAGPLGGVRVLELGALTAGPLAGRLLGALGADVLKIEPAKGEKSRELASAIDGSGYLYYLNNTDKRGTVLDATATEDRETIAGLIDDADVVLTNLSSVILTRAGLDHVTVRARHPQVVYATVSGYGRMGEGEADRAFDTTIQGESGQMSITGTQDGDPVKTAISIVDLLGAGMLTVSTIGALVLRRRFGEVPLVDVALYDTALWSTHRRWAEALTGSGRVVRHGRWQGDRLVGIVSCVDGEIAVDASAPIRGEALARIVGGSARRDVEHWAASRTISEALVELVAADIPATPVLDLVELVELLTGSHPDVLVPQTTPAGSAVTVFSAPWRFARSTASVRRRAPGLNEHPPAWSSDQTGAQTGDTVAENRSGR